MINDFGSIDIVPVQVPDTYSGLDYATGVAELQVGAGATVMRSNRSGLWLGASQFANAPFRVDMNGNVTITSADGRTFSISSVNNQLLFKDVSGNTLATFDGTGLKFYDATGHVVAQHDATGMTLKDAAGSILATLTNTGLAINNGKIVVQNNSGSTTLDGGGIVSSTNTSILSTSNQMAQNTTSNSYVDVTNSAITFTASNTRPVSVLFIATMLLVNTSYAPSNGYTVNAQIALDGSLVGTIVNQSGIYSTNPSNAYAGGSTSAVKSVSAGSHTVKLQFLAAGAGTASIESWVLSVIIIGS